MRAYKHRVDEFHDGNKQPSSAQLQKLSDEVSRIAARLAELSAPPREAEPPAPIMEKGDVPEVPLGLVRNVIRARRQRAQYFDGELFADPAWDMMLDLLHAEIAHRRVSISSLCVAAAVPATTALRWIKSMTDAGLFHRRPDPRDARRIFIELSPSASASLRHYFRDLGRAAVV